ncbi:MAG TPA: glutamine synthetase III, partial [Longimicrobiales bacterium]
MQTRISRFDALAAAKSWSPAANGARPAHAAERSAPPRAMDIEKIFGENTFGLAEMKVRLPRSAYRALLDTIQNGSELDAGVADAVALAMKEWATERGATHFTHWFQPLTGLTAEKHDSFITPNAGGGAIAEFSGKDLIQGEPDASSFPSGGLRATFEARGYTAWDPTSPAFIVEGSSGSYLAIPTAFASWTGDALDQKIPLLRSVHALDRAVRRALALFGVEAGPVVATVGPEQEFFLVDQEFYYRRPDLVTTGRTLFGAKPPRGQELEDHYFGSIPERVLAFMMEVERELYRLGVPIKTRHNEVAPGQYEMAPIYENANVAADHQQLMMAVLRRTAPKYGLVALLHEKPFAGVNGSGKHLNWSFGTAAHNLLEPGDSPHENLQFLFFCTAVLRAVERHQDLVRASVAYAGNDHRLGANEAPPAIISVFMGAMLTRLIENIIAGKESTRGAEHQLIKLGVNKLPEIEQDNTDRNRTSPFAFTGAKFEFRAVGSSQGIGFPVTLLNAAVAESIGEITTQLRSELKKTKQVNDAVMKVVRAAFAETASVRFEGNNYSDEWVVEAERRGLPNVRRTPESLAQLITKPARALFTKLGILSTEELESRYHVRLERYAKDMLIELHTMHQIVDTQVLPACYAYHGMLADCVFKATSAGMTPVPQMAAGNRVGALIETLRTRRGELEALIAKAESMHDRVERQATFLTADGAECMEATRSAVDALE